MERFQGLGDFAKAVYKAQVDGVVDYRLESAEIEPEDCLFTEEELREIEGWVDRLIEISSKEVNDESGRT